MPKQAASVLPSFAPLGEQAVIVIWGNRFVPAVHRKIVRLAKWLEHDPFPGFQECVPSYTSLCVYYDLARASYETVCRRIQTLWEKMPPDGPGTDSGGRTVEIPVCYCEICGPDLPALAAEKGLTADEAALLHSGSRYTVSMIGFMPGFPYMWGLPSVLSASRLRSPRQYVAQGSVALADGQTGIYPVASPGGWRIVGRTPVRLFRPDRPRPSLLAVGDTVVFIPANHDVVEGAAQDGSCS